ncbi:hypothetical protein [Candidatus Amarolinea dominans]|uniref:hypothetical protein n=1 Tax=Candidatus Amarolinea dominans TaxID=3140696 RepID=UPI001D4C5B5F|nr:hypothetical protein [Anaerolineae bacterium]
MVPAQEAPIATGLHKINFADWHERIFLWYEFLNRPRGWRLSVQKKLDHLDKQRISPDYRQRGAKVKRTWPVTGEVLEGAK